MRKGDIVINPWVSAHFDGKLNPNYATIYLGDNQSLDYTGRVCKWADKIYKDNPERKTPWKVIDHIDLYSIVELAIRYAVLKEEVADRPSCGSCKWDSEEWYDSHCDSCVAHIDKPSNYEPQTDCEACELDSKADVCKICRVSNYEPQPGCPWK